MGLVVARREARATARKAGQLAAQEREEKVEEAQKIEEHHDRPSRCRAPTVPKSERIVREKQVPLFADLPDSPLPQLSLLDPPDTHIERPTAETLELPRA